MADVYDALTSKRPYKRPLSHERSREIVIEGRGTQFDPEVVDAFLRHQDEFREISLCQMNVTEEDCVTGLQRMAISIEQLANEASEAVGRDEPLAATSQK